MAKPPLRNKNIAFPEKYRAQIEAMICGDTTTSTIAKRQLMAAGARAAKTDTKEYQLLKRIYGRIKI